MLNLKLLLNILICTFTHPKNLPKVYLKQTDGSRMVLVPLDVLLWHGHTLLNKAIQICTGSKYNHAALYIGNGRVLHAVGKGLVIQTLSEAWTNSDKFIDVYRYHWLDVHGTTLTFKQRDKLIEVANKYYAQSERYAVEALIMLAVISELRKNADFLGRKFIDKAFQALNDAFEAGKEPVICSEIVYRIFDEAGMPLKILPEGLYEEFRNSQSLILRDFINQKENRYQVSADFVTPQDLAISPDLAFVGELQKELS